jgi:hypothetical protein
MKLTGLTTMTEAGWTETAISRFLPAPVIEERRSSIYGKYRVRLWDAPSVLLAAQGEPCRTYFAAIEKRRTKSTQHKVIDVLDATREASRSAHRWRDRASDAWDSGRRAYAATCSANKRHWYSLKEQGIVALHRAGTLRYAGSTPQGMAVYEYGDGGMSCLHSTLHPVGVERSPVEGHPETLFVIAKRQELKLRDVEITLQCLPCDTQGYEKSAPPHIPRVAEPLTCYRCGATGHIARECADWYDVA